MNFREELAKTLKSSDTEEWLDVYFTRPIGFLWAKFFAYFGVHPNVVTILSICLGVGAGCMFYYSDTIHNVLGVLLLMWANFYDSADGQLARMTGKKTQWGRILDGFAGDVWFFVIYFCLCLRLMPQKMPFLDETWGYWIWGLAFVAGILCHARQCKLADYYRNIHLFFLKGKEGSELDNATQQFKALKFINKKQQICWYLFLWGYANYTKSQEQMTPCFQTLMQYLHQKGLYTLPLKERELFLKESKKIMPLTNILTFNARAIILYISCLIDEPWLYFVFEITLFSLIYLYMHRFHERLCKKIIQML